MDRFTGSGHQGKPLGQGVEQLASLKLAHQCFQIYRYLRLARSLGMGWRLDVGRRSQGSPHGEILAARTNCDAAGGAGSSGGCSPHTASQHPLDEPDVDDLGVQRASAGVIDALTALRNSECIDELVEGSAVQ
ncbi:hypothetical protein [Mycobacterium haemophilum]|uniref:Uncharacterized protein n=1 Tax=Mycobacterium haemophilum TaxID=29311 RepID=A0A0I9UCN7_9MYCO|nr:hypothetical protein [Mycobacterium haemophilum]KLO33392.1 hypothetical protein ABH39_00570 [Mycobacterium haemophilum]KLO38915.1 hypothetical protein ABH38_00570 [Mycobacterium haemophilum]KLO45334.1 hypothetical protein ABH37_00570 [Mycobacterium haemophilum]KLO56483.1 hypothetical protein ABH36_00570 [Mycobacterium haemophilum]